MSQDFYSLRGRVILVTGSSRGIGRAIALEAARRGARGVVVNYRTRKDEAIETASLAGRLGAEAIVVRGDVSVYSEAARVVKAAVERFGAVDVLVNNAGVLKPKGFQSMEPRDWEEVFKVHVFGSMNMARAAIEHMASGGVIVNISSVLALRPEEGASHYSAAKAAILAWTLALARELTPSGIRVFAVAPGGVDTAMARSWGNLDWVEEEIPIARLARPEEVAKLVVDAIENPYITGDILTISGGLL